MMEIKEFREKGYLQEINRRFLHPIGLALMVEVDDDGHEIINGIIDNRDEIDGMYYNLANSSNEKLMRFKNNKIFIDNEIIKYGGYRFENSGFNIEPIPQFQTDEKTLAENGWVIECESPLEIRNEDGSVATLNAAKIIIDSLTS